MANYAIYDKLDEQFKKDKELLNMLKISTNFNKVNIKNLINEIYVHCLKEAYYYSYDSICFGSQHKYYFFNGINSFYTMKSENLIKEHCIVSTLYTVQYLLLKNVKIMLPQLASGFKNSGHNYILEKVKIDYEKIESVKIIDIKDEDHYKYKRGISENFKKKFDLLKEYKRNNIRSDSYLDKMINIEKSDENEQSDGKNYVPLFMSNITYGILNNINFFKTNDMISKIKEEKNKKQALKYKAEFIEEYFNCVNNISYEKENSHEVDQILFKYHKERMLNNQLISKLFDKWDNSNWLPPIECIDVEQLKLSMFLPNSFSRVKIAYSYITDIDNEYNSKDILNDMLKISFPIFEKTFFITLYDYCKKICNSESNSIILNKMNDLLVEYFENFNLLETFEDERIEYNNNLKDKNTSERLSIMYDVLEYFFENSELLDEYKYKGSSCNPSDVNDPLIFFDPSESEFKLPHIKMEIEAEEMQKIKKRNEEWLEKSILDSIKQNIYKNYYDFINNVDNNIHLAYLDTNMQADNKKNSNVEELKRFKKTGYESFIEAFNEGKHN